MSTKTLELLKKLVSIPSVFPNEERLADYIVNYLKGLNFNISKVSSGAKRYNILATLGSSEAYLGFYGHMDTVSAEGWRDPYRVDFRGNIARGLGVADMKGGLVAMLRVAEFASANNLPVKLVFGVDEENISQGAHDLVNSGLLNDISFLISAEIGQIENIRQPFSLVYGRKGRILYEIKVYGKRAHAAEPEKGINAVEQSARLVQELSILKFDNHPRFGCTNLVIHSINTGIDSFSVPDICILRISLLTTPVISNNQFRKTVLSSAKKLNTRISIETVKRNTPYGESYEVDLNNNFLRVLGEQIFIPNGVRATYASSIADENIFANRLKIPVISLGPIAGGEHTTDEWLDLKSLNKLIEIYNEILQKFNFLLEKG